MSPAPIRSFDYAILQCRNLSATKAFYQEVMGFRLDEDRGNWVSFGWVSPS